MSKYLEAAADLIKKAADENERHTAPYPTTRNEIRVELAKLFTLLAAVDKGLMPEAVAEEIYGQLKSK